MVEERVITELGDFLEDSKKRAIYYYDFTEPTTEELADIKARFNNRVFKLIGQRMKDMNDQHDLIAKAHYRDFATGKNLDNLATMYDVLRLEDQSDEVFGLWFDWWRDRHISIGTFDTALDLTARLLALWNQWDVEEVLPLVKIDSNRDPDFPRQSQNWQDFATVTVPLEALPTDTGAFCLADDDDGDDKVLHDKLGLDNGHLYAGLLPAAKFLWDLLIYIAPIGVKPWLVFDGGMRLAADDDGDTKVIDDTGRFGVGNDHNKEIESRFRSTSGTAWEMFERAYPEPAPAPRFLLPAYFFNAEPNQFQEVTAPDFERGVFQVGSDEGDDKQASYVAGCDFGAVASDDGDDKILTEATGSEDTSNFTPLMEFNDSDVDRSDLLPVFDGVPEDEGWLIDPDVLDAELVLTNTFATAPLDDGEHKVINGVHGIGRSVIGDDDGDDKIIIEL